MTPEQHAETIAKAELLRAKFRSWALQHKAVLASMLAAQPTDTAAQMAAWNSLPWKCSEAGILGTELCPSGEPFVGVTFSWNPVQSGPLDATIIAKLATQQQRVVSFMDRRIQELRQDRFIKQRDIVLSSSVSAAPTQINLWVSGRITEKTKLSDEDRAKMLSDLKASGKPLHEADLWGPDRAVMPPYEFLKSTITPKENTL